MGFLYFADGWTNPITSEVVGQLDLRHAFDGVPMHGVIDHSPSGSRGTIMAVRSDADLAYRPDHQTWRKRPGDACVYVGMATGSPPTEKELRREKPMAGDYVELAGQRWLIPKLMVYAAGSGFEIDLPCRADLDDSGKWCNGPVVDEYKPLAKFAERLYEGMVRAELGKAPRLSTEELLDLSCELLTVNYRVSRLEVAMLGLLAVDENLKRIAQIAADWKTFDKWFQKKSAENQ